MQEHLSKWGEEKWQTREGSANAKQSDGTQKRYLPKKAWEEMSGQEKEETDKKKQQGSKKGNQFVGNTSRAKSARENANEAEDEEFQKKKEVEKNANNQRETRSQARGRHEGKDNHKSPSREDAKQAGTSKSNRESKEAASPSKGEKRGRSQETSGSENANKKQKSTAKGTNGTVGSKHDKPDAPAKLVSVSRLPKKDQSAYWKAMPGWIDGKVVEVLKTNKTIEGKQVKASKDDPRIVLKSNSSGKICIHKVDNV